MPKATGPSAYGGAAITVAEAAIKPSPALAVRRRRALPRGRSAGTCATCPAQPFRPEDTAVGAFWVEFKILGTEVGM